MEIVNNLSIIALLSQILSVPIKLFSPLNNGLFELIFQRLVNIKMINPNAGLPTIKKFTKKNSKRGIINVSSLIDNDRTFSTQFQNARSKISSSLDSNKSSSYC